MWAVPHGVADIRASMVLHCTHHSWLDLWTSSETEGNSTTVSMYQFSNLCEELQDIHIIHKRKRKSVCKLDVLIRGRQREQAGKEKREIELTWWSRWAGRGDDRLRWMTGLWWWSESPSEVVSLLQTYPYNNTQKNLEPHLIKAVYIHKVKLFIEWQWMKTSHCIAQLLCNTHPSWAQRGLYGWDSAKTANCKTFTHIHTVTLHYVHIIIHITLYSTSFM